MGLEKMIKELKGYLSEIDRDLDKTLQGNKTAAQRVRTMSIEFAKRSKQFRAESLKLEKKKK